MTDNEFCNELHKRAEEYFMKCQKEFAIKEIEKIKEEIQKYVDENFYSEDLYLAGCGDGAYHSLAIIDKKINELKGETE